jgi:hypothetical protein
MAQIDWYNTLAGMSMTLLDQEHIASGKLYQSVKADTFERAGKVRSLIKSLARGEDIDQRRLSVVLSIPQILTWMTRKQQTVYSSKKFEFKGDTRKRTNLSKRQTAYAIKNVLENYGTLIYFNGKSKTGWITKNYNRHKIDIDKRLTKYVLEDFKENIDRVLRELAAKDPNIKIIR